MLIFAPQAGYRVSRIDGHGLLKSIVGDPTSHVWKGLVTEHSRPALGDLENSLKSEIS